LECVYILHRQRKDSQRLKHIDKDRQEFVDTASVDSTLSEIFIGFQKKAVLIKVSCSSVTVYGGCGHIATTLLPQE
jgi:hypothetical protein